MIQYKVKYQMDGNYEVIRITKISGERLNMYESEPDEENEEQVYSGRLADCESYIRLREGGYM